MSLRASPAALALAMLPLLAACEPPKAANDASRFPAYAGRSSELFDDSLAPHTLTPTVDKVSLKNDATFRERVLVADGVARVKVTTVTNEHRGDRDSIHLQLSVQSKLAGFDPTPGLDLDVAEGAPAFFALKQAGTSLGGRGLVVAWKHFKGGSDGVVHWFGAPDDDDTRGAVDAAAALREVKGQ